MQLLKALLCRTARGGCVVGIVTSLSLAGCHKKKASEQAAPETTSKPQVTANRRDLSPELAGKVLARVGERTITLGDYVSALERMDPFERLRYQTPDRRKLLLKEMIDVELLAREAERRGLDKKPETQLVLRQMMREELQRQLRADVPALNEIPAQEVHQYYQQHLAEFKDPERRRVSVIVLRSKRKAEKLLEEARDSDAVQWGKLVRAQSILAPKSVGSSTVARPPLDLEGDLGLVSGPGEERGNNPDVPAAVREAVFKIEKQGGVFGEAVKARGRYYLVRLVGKSDARTRELSEVEDNIRVRLTQQRLHAAEQKLEQELRKKYPVKINNALLSKLKLPKDSQVLPASDKKKTKDK